MDTPSKRLARLYRGLSETAAIAVLLGLAIALSTSFAVYMYSDYAVRQDAMLIQRVIESEKAGTVVRLILPEGGGGGSTQVLLLRRLDGGDRVYLFLSNGTNYISCGDAIKNISGGRLVGTYVHDVSKIMVVSREGVYSYRYYARAYGYPETGPVEVCAIEVDRNAVATFQLVREPEPIAVGRNSTYVEANSRSWRLYGTIEFNVSYLGNPRGIHLYVNDIGYQLKVGDTVRIDVDTSMGKIDLTRGPLPTGDIGAWILAFNVSAKEVRVNNALLAKNVQVRITSDVAIDLKTLKSTLTIEIFPTPPGFTRVRYGGRTIVEHWNNSDYIRIVDWKLGLDPDMWQLVLELTATNLYAQGVARAIYIGDLKRKPVDRFSAFIVTYVNNVPYLVDVYDYRFS